MNVATEEFFSVLAPAEQRVPFVFNSPHSGSNYPPSLVAASRLTPHTLRMSEDVLVDRLFDSVVMIGAPLLRAHFPRAWLDVNREPYELDPKLFREKLPAHANTRSIRVAGGLGTVPRLVSENLPIYEIPPTLADGMERIEQVYRPYHETLRKLIAQSVVQFGYGVLVDCHSMPSSDSKSEQKVRPDIIVGDRYGTSCNGEISGCLIDQFSALGYTVARNKPYAGGFITEHYGRPLKGLHAVQVEINRALYIDEATLQPHEGFEKLRLDIRQVISNLVSLPDSGFFADPIAAE
ncbi:MAG: N-formylglutamate amidohydrolase [Pseudomonadota bacterium]